MKIMVAIALACSVVLMACGDDDNNKAAGTPKATVASQGVKPGTSTGGAPPTTSPTKPASTAPTLPAAASSPEPLSDGNAPGIPPLTGEIKTDGELRYIDEKVGDGATPKRGQRLSVKYTGWLTNGNAFAPGPVPHAFPLGVGSVIPGWDQGIATMKVGGKRRLIIPASLGYGALGNPGGCGVPRVVRGTPFPAVPCDIPPNSTLIFDVELISIQQ